MAVPMCRCHVTTLPRDGEIETIRAKSLGQEVADDREHGLIIIEDRLCFVYPVASPFEQQWAKPDR